MIEIDTIKVAVDGIKKRKILNIGDIQYISNTKYRNGLHEMQPLQAMNCERRPGIWVKKETSMEIGDIIDEVDFQKSLDEIRKCITSWREIKQEIVELEKTWNGKETFIL